MLKLFYTTLAVALLGQIPYGLGAGGPCLMAQHLAAAQQPDDNPNRQEREVPNGHWCQRAAPKMSAKAHACACHQHDCQADPSDINTLSAHTDPRCLDYCKVNKCLCGKIDCP